MENEEVQAEDQEPVQAASDASGMTDAERAKKEKEKERQRKKREAKKEKEKEAKEAKKDKDKGGKDGQKKEGDKKKKTPADLIKEQLRKRQEEEERLRKEQDAEEQRLMEIERQRLEKLELEKERKERKKQKEKEKIAKLKKEGKYLTADQKQKLQRQREMIEMMKQQGILVQGAEAKETAAVKKPRYGDKKKPTKTGQTAENGQSGASHEATPEVPADDVDAEPAVKEEGGVKEEVAESWDQLEEQVEDGADEESSSEEDESTEGDEEENAENEPPTEKPAAVPQSVPQDTPQEPSSQPIVHETKEETRERILNRIKKRRQEALAKRSDEDLRSPVVCVLGHVDTGKTKILDKIRRTHVQDGEAGGITQQIGATMVPAQAIKDQAKMVKDFEPELLRVPGFLIIDTPGHESFSNLRSRGSSLCDIAILVVDIMHALEPQTIESLEMLKKRNTPFVVALNKVDRLYEWKSSPNKDIRNVIKAQQRNTQAEFNERVEEVKLKFAEQGVNATLFWENRDPTEYVSLVPTSAISGDGMGNLIASLVHYSQSHLKDRISFCDTLRCTILEVKVLPGLGTTIDVILVDGTLRVGDTIIVPGTEGPIVTQIRELLMPQPLREMRVKNPYEHFKEVKGAQGVKVLAKDLEKTLAGLPLLVAQHEDEVELLKDEVANSLKAALKSFTTAERGVYVQASTLGALEALLTFLRDQKIPYCGINIGPVHKRDVVKASTMLEHDSQWAVILAFDVKIERDAQTLADETGVRIFSADIIYHLQDAYIKFREEWKQKKRQENAHLAVFPVKMRVLPAHVYNSRDPLVMGVMIEDGIAKIGTPICVPSKEGILLGTISSLEANHKTLDSARKGQEVCVKIENTTGDAPKMYGRHFDFEDLMVSKITRESIDVMKTYFRDDLQKTDWQLIVELKKSLGVL